MTSGVLVSSRPLCKITSLGSVSAQQQKQLKPMTAHLHTDENTVKQITAHPHTGENTVKHQPSLAVVL